jgi:ribonuclease D
MPHTLPPPVWVATPESFAALVADLSKQTRIAVDTESNSLHAYREQVCLIQFSTETDYLVDPFALSDLSPLAPIFANPKIEKVFHAAEYDLICLYRDFGFTFASLFDTMQAARILGRDKVGLEGVLAEYFGVAVNKKFQKADWGARPLTPEQINYARFDTHYLIRLRDMLQADLEAAGRWELAREDFRRACWVDQQAPSRNNPAWERLSRRRDLSSRELTVLCELCEARENIAERLDRPPFKVMDDDVLIAIARGAPSTREELLGLGLSERQVGRWSAEMLAAVARGVNAPPVRRPRLERPDDAVLVRLEKLKSWRKKVAQKMGVESDIVLPRPFLFSLAERGPRELKSVMAASPWRLEQFGPQILDILGG